MRSIQVDMSAWISSREDDGDFSSRAVLRDLHWRGAHQVGDSIPVTPTNLLHVVLGEFGLVCIRSLRGELRSRNIPAIILQSPVSIQIRDSAFCLLSARCKARNAGSNHNFGEFTI